MSDLNVTVSQVRNRVYQRKFDWDQAKRMRDSGMTIADIAAALGVSYGGVRRVVDPHYRAMLDVSAAEYQRTHWRRKRMDQCKCGAEKTKSANMCAACHRDKFDVDVGPSGTLRCHLCDRFLPTEVFPTDNRKPLRGFRRTICRSCDSRRRKLNRERRKVPCASGCGAFVTHPDDTNKRGYEWSGLCRGCWNAARRNAA